MYVDTHAHLDMLDDPAQALCNAARAGVTRICTIVNVLEEPENTFEHLEDWILDAQARLGADGTVPKVKIIVGTHPHIAQRSDKATDDAIRTFAKDPRVVGLGELGLDYHYDHSPRQIQRTVFARQLKLAHELNLPVCLHLRSSAAGESSVVQDTDSEDKSISLPDAHSDGFRILREIGLPARGAILHCFGLDYLVAAPFIDLGCHVSFAGPVTFKRAEEVRLATTLVPLNRIFSETDCPFMSPEPVRGTRNEPANVAHVADMIARSRPESSQQVLAALASNAEHFFGFARE